MFKQITFTALGAVGGSMVSGSIYNMLEFFYVKYLVRDKKTYYSLRGYLHRNIIPLFISSTGAFGAGYLTYKILK
jgi:hypothetical protein